ncbi:hypothetical protein Bca52824_052662 [Brassica carinata]|uniref:Uncharacterized protein n=1 Tax=Brassica carinata TaxID=52824 RepID=A0A8X7R4W7_BRACI|nr:hypothetical protein Bca52824_052662 [Brassica carinata]
MEPRKRIVCGLSARGIIPPLSEEDRDDDVAPLPQEDPVEVVDISDEEEEDIVELSHEEYMSNMGYFIRVEESEDDIEPGVRRMLERMQEEEMKLREEKFKVLKSGIKQEKGQSSKGDGNKRKGRKNPKTTFVLTTLLLSREKLRERGTEPPLVDFRPRLGYAYAWTCLVKACGGNGERLVSFLFVGDFRERLNPPLPATYFGKDGFVTAGEILSGLDLTSQFGSNRLGVYQSDLGWGRPVKTDVVSHSRRGNLHGRET